MTENKRKIVWSNGLGTQSTAIAIEIANGSLPKPELSITADTGREHEETWLYAEKYTFPLLRELGVSVEIARHELATVDLIARNGDTLLPAFTSTGKLPTFCSNEWKRRVVLRRLRQLGYGPKNPVAMWLGMSRDEIVRMKGSDVQWLSHTYPLALDLRLSRADCIARVTAFGWPTPPRSRCFMCPHQGNREWREIRAIPAEWSIACEIDQQLSIQHGARLHRSNVPLDEADIEDHNAQDGQLSLFSDACDNGACEF